MDEKMAHHRLRAGMTSALVVLLAVGLSLQHLNAQAADVAASQPTPKVSRSASAQPTQSSPTALSASDQQILSTIQSAQVAKGCKLNVQASSTSSSMGTCNVLIVGDSIGNNLSVGLKAELTGIKGIKVSSRSKSSTGLSNSWFYNWPEKFAPMLKQYKPNLVFIMMGANDHQDMKVGKKIVHFGTAAWTAQYAAGMRAMTTAATKAGAYVVWVGLPVMRPASYAKAMKTLNSIYEDVASGEAGVSYIATHDYFADSKGRFRAWAAVNGKRSKIRGDDGIHFARDGQPVLATYVLDQIQNVFHVTIAIKSPKRITG